MKQTALFHWITLLFVTLFVAATSLNLFAASQEAIVLNITGPIGPATYDYIDHGLHYAANQQANIVILRLDTPGGLETSMRQIDQAILASPVPVVTYVSPTGARAASAGTFILYASAIAAMAPGTEIGAASPVHLHTFPFSKPINTAEQKINQEHLSQLELKEINDAAASLRALAELRGRNATWAEQAVRNAASLSATEALNLKVIDVIADSIPDLLTKLNGRQIHFNQQVSTLQTQNLQVREYKPDWRYQLLSILTNPNIAYILLLIGMYGLFLEFYHPGFIVPGVFGIISLLLALYGFQLLPVNFVGIALILLGAVLMIIEILISSFGILGIGGIAAFITGSILLLDLNSPGYYIAWRLIATMTIISIAFFLVIVWLAIHAMRKKIITGKEAMIGSQAVVIRYSHKLCLIKFHGETWRAISTTPLQPGESVRIIALSGLTVIVEPLTTSHQPTVKEN
jgi:membrane-bound serine protease (ClpP class)